MPEMMDTQIAALEYPSDEPEPPAPIPKPTPEQLKAIDMVLDGDAPTECREYDLIWCPTDKLSPTDMLTMSKCGELSFRGKLRWHLKDAPPAPDDTNKGVWFKTQESWPPYCWARIKPKPEHLLAILVDGKKFTPEGVPDGFCQNSCGYFSLVRRFRGWLKNCHSLHSSLAKDFAELRAINAEVKRMFPKAGGE